MAPSQSPGQNCFSSGRTKNLSVASGVRFDPAATCLSGPTEKGPLAATLIPALPRKGPASADEFDWGYRPEHFAGVLGTLFEMVGFWWMSNRIRRDWRSLNTGQEENRNGLLPFSGDSHLFSRNLCRRKN